MATELIPTAAYAVFNDNNRILLFTVAIDSDSSKMAYETERGKPVPDSFSVKPIIIVHNAK
jgi:hypothetical protein